MDNDFYKVDSIKFVNDGVKEALFFYVHHDLRLDSINEKLDKMGLRAADESDLAALFFLHEMSLLSYANFHYGCITTTNHEAIAKIIDMINSKEDPTDALRDLKAKIANGDTVLPAIFRNENGDPFMQLKTIHHFIPGHESTLIMAVKK